MDEETFLQACRNKDYAPVAIIHFTSALALAKPELLSQKRLSGEAVFEQNQY